MNLKYQAHVDTYVSSLLLSSDNYSTRFLKRRLWTRVFICFCLRFKSVVVTTRPTLTRHRMESEDLETQLRRQEDDLH